MSGVSSIRVNDSTKEEFDMLLLKEKIKARRMGKKLIADGLVLEMIKRFKRN